MFGTTPQLSSTLVRPVLFLLLVSAAEAVGRDWCSSNWIPALQVVWSRIYSAVLSRAGYVCHIIIELRGTGVFLGTQGKV